MYTTHVSFLLDESGSMTAHREKTIDAFNLYIQGLRGNGKIHCSLRKFASTLRDYLYQRVPVAHVADMNSGNYYPDGNTCLYDAIVETLDDRTKDCGPTESQVIVVLTDGENTSSKRYAEDARDAITKARRRGWQILFLGASFDVTALAARLGVDKKQTLTYRAGTDSAEALKRLAGSIDAFANEEPHEEYSVTDAEFTQIDDKPSALRIGRKRS